MPHTHSPRPRPPCAAAVAVVEPDYKVKVQWAPLTPNDPSYPMEWHHPRISSPGAWATTTGSSAVKVGAERAALGAGMEN